MNIAVTGASGHIGVNLCRKLIEEGHQVQALIHRNASSLKDIPLKKIRGDLNNPSSLASLAREADVVIHLAAAISISRKKKPILHSSNVEGTRNILSACIREKVSRFIHFSSIHALEQKPLTSFLDEERPLAVRHRMAYSRTKALAEAEILKAVQAGLDAVILSPTAVIGPEDHEPSLIGRALILLAEGKLPALVAGGYNWVDVRDVADAASAALNKGRTGERYLLSGNWGTLREISKMTAEIAGCHTHRFTCPLWLARLGIPFLNMYCRLNEKEPLYTRDSLHALKCGHPDISNAKAREELSFSPRPLDVTLRDTLEWFRQQGYVHP